MSAKPSVVLVKVTCSAPSLLQNAGSALGKVGSRSHRCEFTKADTIRHFGYPCGWFPELSGPDSVLLSSPVTSGLISDPSSERLWSDRAGCPLSVQKEVQPCVFPKEVLPFVTTWMNLPDITLGGISPTEKDKCYMISFICGIYRKYNVKNYCTVLLMSMS